MVSDETMPSALNLSKLRKRAGLTQRQAAGLVGVSFPTFKAWEYGQREAPEIKFLLFRKKALLMVKLQNKLKDVYLDSPKLIIEFEDKINEQETFW